MTEQAPYTKIILWMKGRHSGATVEDIEAATTVPAKSIRQVLKALASMGLASNDGSTWRVSVTANPEVEPVKVVDRATMKERKKAKKRRAQTANERSAIHEVFLACAKTVALAMPEFTTDDVRREFDTKGSFESIDPRISGPIMIKAAKLGYCKPINKRKISDRRQSGHTQVYRSLICETGVLPEDPIDMMSIDELRAEVLRLREELQRVTGVAAVNAAE